MDHLRCELCINLTINIPNSCQHLQSLMVGDVCETDDESNYPELESDDSGPESSQDIYDDSDFSEGDGQYESLFVTTDDEEEWDDGDLSYVHDDKSEDDEEDSSSGSDNDDAEDSSSNPMVSESLENTQQE
jgi:hypothetical protein